nr:nucleoside triphosphate pyrophosphohydrolase [Alkalilimnicola ehrlichii]
MRGSPVSSRFHSQLAEEKGWFDFEAVAAGISDKMIRRHPHIFDATYEAESGDQAKAWEAIKAEERRYKAGTQAPSVLDGVALALPALMRAQKLSKRASRVGFDWDDLKGVFDKVREELAELEAEVEQDAAQARLEDELGDILFACTNLARHLKVDAEVALRGANAKFERRFRHVERLMAERGQALADADMDTLESAWQAAKREE